MRPLCYSSIVQLCIIQHKAIRIKLASVHRLCTIKRKKRKLVALAIFRPAVVWGHRPIYPLMVSHWCLLYIIIHMGLFTENAKPACMVIGHAIFGEPIALTTFLDPNSTQLNFIVTYLQLNSWTAELLNIAQYVGLYMYKPLICYPCQNPIGSEVKG